MEASDYCIISTTTDSKENADAITQLLLDKKLIACVQSTTIQSAYHWQGKIIKSEEQYNQVLTRLDVIFDALPDTPEGDEAEVLVLLIEKYEDENFLIDAPDPIEAIKFRMEQMNMKKKDLAAILGYRSRVTEILKKRRKLTLKMIRNLHEKMNIPYESLIQDY